MRSDNVSLQNERASVWLPLGVWALVIVILTSIPGSDLPPSPIPFLDIAVHIIMYGVLGYLLHRALHRGTEIGPLWWAGLAAFALGLAYGILDEVHQTWVPNRFCAVGDILADGVGVAVGVWVYFVKFVRPVPSATPGGAPNPRP